jgi:hypothetical protein
MRHHHGWRGVASAAAVAPWRRKITFNRKPAKHQSAGMAVSAYGYRNNEENQYRKRGNEMKIISNGSMAAWRKILMKRNMAAYQRIGSAGVIWRNSISWRKSA